jgi:hypothetical protein
MTATVLYGGIQPHRREGSSAASPRQDPRELRNSLFGSMKNNERSSNFIVGSMKKQCGHRSDQWKTMGGHFGTPADCIAAR